MSCSPSSAVTRRTRRFSSGSLSQTGSSSPATSQNRVSVWLGSEAISVSQRWRQVGSSAGAQLDAASALEAMVSGSRGRRRRKRASTPPSSSMLDAVGITRAARLDWELTTSSGGLSEPRRCAASASSAERGMRRSRLTISAISVSALVVGMDEDGFAFGDRERVGAHRLDTEVERRRPSIAAAMLASMRVSSAANSVFCSSIGSASRRLRNRDIGGSSSFRLPSWVSLRPVASSKSRSDQPSIRSAPCSAL